MKANDKRLFVVAACCAAATCGVAALVTHNRTSAPLTLAEVLITAIVPLGLLGYVTVYYTPERVLKGGSTDEEAASRQDNR